ncbi:hypothetical protein GCM10009661_82230 [Catellatospora chokoriensis]|uniref:Uncharacterized protein n=1 Tax=Catellatospora chokoriensis TaxID=310353 RepID=A0A8J3K7F8_9ACTN|nr:hypothetical protein Cch02nite_77110 [Catellatospora chokoriensis]
MNGRIGDIIDTGVPATAGRRWVLYFIPYAWTGSPGTTFAIGIGERAADGTITDSGVQLGDTKGADRAAGFHTLQAPMEYDGMMQPAFGYYVGRPATITARFDGRTVRARTATWSADPMVTAFWFEPADGATGVMTTPSALDADGTPMPVGHGEIYEN